MSKVFKLIISILCLIIFLEIGGGFFYFFVMPPEVVGIFPLDKSLNVSQDSKLTIRFNKPIGRRQINHKTIPETYGEWKFEDPLIGGHLYRTLIFTPAVKFKPNTDYHIKLDNVVSLLNISNNDLISFSFKTGIFATGSGNPDVADSEVFSKIIDVPFHWQKYPLSCEAASLKMALSAKGVNVSEDEIMQKIGYDATRHVGNIWGNPYSAFVGSISGSMCTTGYGVYWEPVAKAASNWRQAEYFSGWNIKDLTDAITLGNPVIFWGSIPTDKLTDCSWYTPKGEYIKAFKQDHVRVIVGFIGNSDNPTKIVIKDPLNGDLYWKTDYFLTNWNIYGNSGVVIK